jgi:hypothetical protein
MGRATMILRLSTIARLVALSFLAATPLANADDLEKGFATPPESARPRVWWHWMNGNVTRQGITADLEWMQRIGLGGVQMFDADIGTAQYVEQRVGFMTPLWLDHVQHTVTQANRLGLEVAITPTSGWSESGGPWIKPAQAMKKYVWSETRVDGPRKFAGVLAAPPGNTGPFQNVGFHSHSDNLPAPNGAPGGKPYAKPSFPDSQWYADAAVIAYRLPDGEQAAVPVAATTSGAAIDARRLADGDVDAAQDVAVPASGPAWVQLDYGRPVRAQALTVALGPVVFPQGVLQASDDGVAYRTVAMLPGSSHNGLTVSHGVRTFAFPETRARYFRLEMGAPVRGELDDIMGKPRATSHKLAEFALASGAQVNRFEDKAGFSVVPEFDSLATPSVAADLAISGESVIDLTARLRKDGSLDWEVPVGRWAIMRLGYSLTGQTNDPSTQEGKGLEVDKMSAAHVRSHMEQFIAPLKEKLGQGLGAKGMSHLLLDSWEANQQNWTDDMLAEFRRRRGYDPLRWLPVLSGRVVDSADASDRFLFDFRRTIADLLSDNHFAVITAFAHEQGMKTYGEAIGVNLPTVGDGLQAKGRVDIPMGEFWDRRPDEKPLASHVADVREAASAGHIYGKNIIAAEAFTATPAVPPWSRSPRDLKWLADYNLALGINRFVFHTSVHQPFDDRKPGVSLWIFGQNFTRHETWAEQAAPWVTYLSRASYMMQQGHSVNDIAVFNGEGAPSVVSFHEQLQPAIPTGYAYDYVNLEVLLDRATVKDGRLVLPGGASYSLLVVPSTITRMSLPLLRKLRDLADAGARIVAPRPQGAPGLVEGPEYAGLVAQVWGATDGRSVTGNALGKGKVFWGRDVAAIMEEIKVAPDVMLGAPHPDSSFVSAHRRLGSTDIYFVANQKQRPEQLKASFRVHGVRPELWYPDSGRIAPASYVMRDGRTSVDLDLDAQGSVFVVFRTPTKTEKEERTAATAQPATTLAGPWTLQVPGDARPQALTSLALWSTLEQPQYKYFAGTASYRTSLAVPKAWLNTGQRVLLDLGEVDVMAQLFINGKMAGTLWKAPYRADVTALVKPGHNSVEVRVTNLWANRLIGDTLPDGGARTTFSTFKPYARPGAKLMPSGLAGPVRVLLQSPR